MNTNTMYYTPAFDTYFKPATFSYRALQGRLKAIRTEFSQAVTVKLNSKSAVLQAEFDRLCKEWATLKQEYNQHNENARQKWSSNEQQTNTKTESKRTTNAKKSNNKVDWFKFYYKVATERGYAKGEAEVIATKMNTIRTKRENGVKLTRSEESFETRIENNMCA